MKRYEVTVNGEIYEVSLRELKDNEKVSITNNLEENTSKKVNKSNNSDGFTVKSPMGGVIVSIKVKENQTVKSGDTLFILGAMKMETEIIAPQDGIVKSILVNESQEVESNQELIII